ncbi:MAG: hypothetical protein IJK06_12615 [Clostridia bacterium]|nr:hypothetical protein [Clostridia bacterium]
MANDQELMMNIRAAIDDCTRGVDEAPSLRYEILRKAKGEEPMVKKISMTLVIALVILVLAAAAVAATVLWKDAGEKVAELEGEYGYYDTWDTATKVELVRDLYEMEALKGNADAERLLQGEGVTDAEKDALCDRIMLDYIGEDQVDMICLETILSTLNDVEGGTPAWSVEDKYWYNQMLEKYGMLTSEDPKFILPEEGEINQEEAVRIARTLLESKSDRDLDDGIMSPYFEEDIAGRRIWTIWYDLRTDGEFRGNPLYVYLKADGTVLSYHIPELYALHLVGMIPDAEAVPEEQALATGRKAMAEKLGVTEGVLNGVKAYYTVNEYDYAKTVDGKMDECQWLVDCVEQKVYAIISRDGTLVDVKKH